MEKSKTRAVSFDEEQRTSSTLHEKETNTDDDQNHVSEQKVGQLSSVQLALQQLRPTTGKRIAIAESVEKKTSRKEKRSRSGSAATAEGDASENDETIGATTVCKTTIKEDLKRWHIDSRIARILSKQFGITNFFALQQYAIEAIITHESRDVCLSAPTGSGKTLIYAIPLIHALQRRLVMRCRGLILLPSRELARQVYDVMNVLCQSVGLKCAVLAGETSLNQESNTLVGARGMDGKCYESLVDVVVATPGRLLDHVGRTEGFTLEHLEYFVVDEADRMLNQSYNDWLDRIYHAANRRPNESMDSVKFTEHEVFIPDQRNFRPLVSTKVCVADIVEQDGRRMRRILCSATLTSNPQKLAALALQHPLLVDSRAMSGMAADNTRDHLPTTLREIEYKVTAKSKPLVLLHVVRSLLSDDNTARVLIFSSAVDRASRIHSLLSNVLGKNLCSMISSNQTKTERATALEQFKNRTVRVLVASDLAARGIDIPQLEYVVSYDVPAHATTYVHRAGRTARAGLKGTSIVLLRTDQARHYRQIKNKLGLTPLDLKVVEVDELVKQQEPFDQWKAATASSVVEMEDNDD